MEWFTGILSTLVSIVLGFLPANTIAYDTPFSWPQKPSEVVVLFGGDMMFDRSIRTTMAERGDDFVFSCIVDVLRGADMVVANLEGPITTFPSKSVGSVPGGPNNTRFTFATSTASLLARHNIQIVSVGNNHINDFGEEGIAMTKEVLLEAGVFYFGDPIDGIVYYDPRYSLAFIAYNDFDPRGSDISKDYALIEIRRARENGYQPIVFAHWGDEYVPPSSRMRDLAHAFVDAGAEIVIGAHPHVVLDHEEYTGTHIYYSLGNFIFDQYFSEEVRNGLLVEVRISKEGVQSVREISIRLDRDRRTCVQ